MSPIADIEPLHGASASSKLGLCPLCNAPLHDPNSCDRCDWVKGYGNAALKGRRNPRDLFACVLSLFWPGAGHFYKGHTPMAIVLACLGLLCFLWSITFFMFFGFLAIPVFWIAVAANAYFLEDRKHLAPSATVARGVAH
jgi:TM2 domain-containing membrane protein YozV